ncbi:MAG: hotdog domain-containing protein [Candidatus Latescibacterota bacterium]
MMPRDTNQYGTIFGGVILSYIDQAGHAGAQHVIRSAGWPDPVLVTVALDRVEFREPVFVGDVVSFWSTVLRVGRTSITVQVEVETRRQERQLGLTRAEVTYVSVAERDGQRQPVPIRP